MTNDRSARMTLVVNLPLKTNLTLDGRWTALVVVASEMGLMALFRTCNPVCCIFRRRMQISLVTLLLLGFVASKKYKDVNVSSCPRSKQVEWLFQPQCNVCINLKVRKVVDCFLQWRQNLKWRLIHQSRWRLSRQTQLEGKSMSAWTEEKAAQWKSNWRRLSTPRYNSQSRW